MDVNENKLQVRNRAIGMLLAGSTQKVVANELGKDIRTVRRWWVRYNSSKDLQHRKGAGRPKKLNRRSKILIAKSLGKRHKSTRFIAKQITRTCAPVSKDTVHRYLTQNLKVRPYKRPKQPKLSAKQRENRLNFCLEKQNWTVADWRNIFWSDESSFELFHPTNRQNDRIWASNSSNIIPQETVKFPPKLMVWGMMNFRAISKLHFIAPKQTVNTAYYIDEILSKSCLDTLNRTKNYGSIMERKMVQNMSKAVFMQDGAPAHTSKKTQSWCKENLANFWDKTQWHGNSPDLNQIENLWGYLQQELDKMEPAKTISHLKVQLESTWATLKPSFLQALVDGMPERVKTCIKLDGNYISK